mgnify:CR=1 FL=1
MRNLNELYAEMREERGVNSIVHYGTPNLVYPTAEQMKEIVVLKHRWVTGDRYYKLAHKHYGDSSLWWVIAWFNKKPTESHVKLGSVVSIPKPLTKILNFLRNS